MIFTADKQTLDDLNVLGKYKANSIFSFFNGVRSAGGGKLLEAMFQHPLTDASEINRRSHVFRYFQSQGLSFPVDTAQLVVMENYLRENGGSSLLAVGLSTFKKQLLGLLVKDEEYARVHSGIAATALVLNHCLQFMDNLTDLDADHPYRDQADRVKILLQDNRLAWLKDDRYRRAVQPGENHRLSFNQVIKYDYLFRHELAGELKGLLDVIYHLDVCLAVADLGGRKDFCYAHALPKESNVVQASELRHPALDKAVGNGLSFHQENNLIFLTGANMAGKSTFMKSFGVSLYLAHMGFPVAAREMSFSVRSGIYTSINVPDNLNMGLSHFYAEVLRVKQVAEEVASGNDLVVIFDELFKGTNVKDAYDATLVVTSAFSEYRNCVFIISTHIIEVGEALRQHDHIQFLYLPTVMEGPVPRYTYKLQEGITTDRQGMMIIENEGVLELLD